MPRPANHQYNDARIAGGNLTSLKTAKINSDNFRGRSTHSVAQKSLRLTGGTFRGRKLITPGTPLTHPMSERARLAIFNMVDVVNLSVADLYAGSGALGFEALSRGAKSVVFIDNSRAAYSAIKANQRNLNLSNIIIQKSSVQTFLTQKNSFDLIFCDPPYDDYHPEDFQCISKILRPHGVLVLSHPPLFSPEIPDLIIIKTRNYASANISILKRFAT